MSLFTQEAGQEFKGGADFSGEICLDQSGFIHPRQKVCCRLVKPTSVCWSVIIQWVLAREAGSSSGCEVGAVRLSGLNQTWAKDGQEAHLGADRAAGWRPGLASQGH